MRIVGFAERNRIAVIINNVLIREATLSDALGLLTAVQGIASEPDHNMTSESDEVAHTLEQERQFIQAHLDDPNALILVAEDLTHNEIIGTLILSAEKRRARRHATSLAIAVHKDWRGKGIGTRLLEEAIRWARRHPEIRRIELQVLARNTGAVALYSRMGFQMEGRAIGAVRKGREYLDEIGMALWIDKVKPQSAAHPQASAVASPPNPVVTVTPSDATQPKADPKSTALTPAVKPKEDTPATAPSATQPRRPV